MSEAMGTESGPLLLPLLDLVVQFCAEYATTEARLVAPALHWLVGGVSGKQWSREAVLAGFGALSALSSLYRYLPRPEDRARHVVATLSRCLLPQLTGGSADSLERDLLVSGFVCIALLVPGR